MSDYYGDTRAMTPRAAGWTILSVALAVLVIYAPAAYGGPREPRTAASA